MIDALRRAVGTAAVRAPIPGDEVHGTMPAAVVAPEDADACAATLAACSEHGWTVEVAGGRTARDGGRSADRTDVLLSTARMSGVVEYEPDDLTIGVAAGSTLGELRARVLANRQRVPLDAPTDRATVGGLLARAGAGPMRLAWSTPRRQTLGLEVVTGDGRVLRVGGRVVKNVAGYDMNKLFVGSAGTLGVITRAHLRLLPLPAASLTMTLSWPERDALIAVARELLAAPAAPAALELIGPEWRLVVRYEGAQEAAGAAAEHAYMAARALGIVPAREDDALARLAVLEHDAALVVRVADQPSRLGETLDAAQRIAAGGGALAAHVGDGVARVLLQQGDMPSAMSSIATSIDEARRSPTRTVIVERAPTDVMRTLDPWGALPDGMLALTRALKRQFDPAGILQRGRWIA